MKVVVLAATGQAGRPIVSELLSRGHELIAAVRDPGKLPASVTAVQLDLENDERLQEIIRGADAVVSAYGPSRNDPRYFTDVDYTDQWKTVAERMVDAVRDARVPRLVVVGGAGSLFLQPGITVLDSGKWPKEYVPIAVSHTKAFAVLRSSDINWTYISPPLMIEPGIRTSKFRVGKDDVIFDESGKSRISFEDFAVAVVDELEKPAHERSRFTVGY